MTFNTEQKFITITCHNCLFLQTGRVRTQTMNTIETVGRTLRDYLNYPLIGMGDNTITLWVLLYTLIGILLLFYLTARLKKVLVNHILIRYTPLSYHEITKEQRERLFD